jgi:predicted PurR-regulated permease PerM
MAVPSADPAPLLPRPVVVTLGLAAAVVVIVGLRGLSDIVGPTFLALVLTVAAHPLRPWVARFGVPEWVASIVAIVVIYLVLIGLAVALLISGARFAELLPTYKEQFQATMQDAFDWLTSLGVDEAQIEDIAGALDLGQMLDLLGGLAGGLLAVLSSLVFIVTLVLFMVFDASGFPKKLQQLPDDRKQLVQALNRFAHGTRTYLVVSTVFGLIVAVIDTLALVWIGVPVAALWGLLAFITNYIPNIGFVIGVIPPAVIGLLEGGWGMMLSVVVVYCVINVVIQSVIQPRVVGDAVGLSPTITMLSLVFWAYALGAIGALMAVPLSLLARAILVDADPRAAWVAPLLTGNEKPSG